MRPCPCSGIRRNPPTESAWTVNRIQHTSSCRGRANTFREQYAVPESVVLSPYAASRSDTSSNTETRRGLIVEMRWRVMSYKWGFCYSGIDTCRQTSITHAVDSHLQAGREQSGLVPSKPRCSRVGSSRESRNTFPLMRQHRPEFHVSSSDPTRRMPLYAKLRPGLPSVHAVLYTIMCTIIPRIRSFIASRGTPAHGDMSCSSAEVSEKPPPRDTPACLHL
nr:hypothetical protein CFP56_57899 [Quercus suber]